MRISRILALLAVGVMLVAAGCTRYVAGTARPDPAKPPVEVSEDGFGVVAGFENAPARIEIFTEPQCPHCADLQADFGDQLAYYIGVGQLKVTYRPLTFLDNETDGHSARVSNALFLAADADATGAEFQRFVEELWAHQQPGGQGP
ncbi:MAG: thioredoxin domain-containing protein, partial [Actinomycetota bacterium]|nr:thioredoxin domain-containing protein [Actinomycetota bacterium]